MFSFRYYVCLADNNNDASSQASWGSRYEFYQPYISNLVHLRTRIYNKKILEVRYKYAWKKFI